MSNADFGKTMENVRKNRDIKVATIERRRNYLVSESNFHTTKFFTENLLATEMKKTEICVNLFILGQVHTGLLRFCAGSNPACGVSEIRDGEDL